ncbi:KdsC family phosphatase, partial [Thermodesulfobacteriota bacterium]
MDNKEKAAEIKLFILDVDGVLTDGRIVINDLGQEIKTFDAKDGYGLVRLIEAGIDVIIISGRKSKAVEYRAENLGIHEVYQGVNDKKALYHDLLKQKDILKNQACCIGDDIPERVSE